MNKYDIVFHVDKADGSIKIAFSNAVNYAKALEKEDFNMVLVVNSGAIAELKADNTALLPPMQKAIDAGLQIKACQNALDANGLKAEQLFDFCSVVPAGVVEIVNLQRAGYAYVKP